MARSNVREPDENGDFAVWLRNALRQRRISNAELARRMDVDRSRISKWTRGYVVPDPSSIRNLADALGVSVAEAMTHAGHLDATYVPANDPTRQELVSLIQLIPSERLQPFIPIFRDLANKR